MKIKHDPELIVLIEDECHYSTVLRQRGLGSTWLAFHFEVNVRIQILAWAVELAEA